MEDFTLVIKFHAENQEDAETQTRTALNAFDDGFEDAKLFNHTAHRGYVVHRGYVLVQPKN